MRRILNQIILILLDSHNLYGNLFYPQSFAHWAFLSEIPNTQDERVRIILVYFYVSETSLNMNFLNRIHVISGLKIAIAPGSCALAMPTPVFS